MEEIYSVTEIVDCFAAPLSAMDGSFRRKNKKYKAKLDLDIYLYFFTMEHTSAQIQCLGRLVGLP